MNQKKWFLVLAVLAIMLPQTAFSLSEHYYDEDFIIASIVIADPSDKALYSALGHACIRMQCPSEGLDFCFSYESEAAQQRIGRFFAGKLNMGMFAVPIDEYVEAYRNDGRGVYEYQLNMPLEARRELWRLLDEQLMKGAYLEYDYWKRGCAITCLHFIEKALGNTKLEYGPWGNEFRGMPRELAYLGSQGNEWFRFLSTIVGNAKCIDGDVPNKEKLIVPIDLVHSLQNATVDGQPLLSNKCHVLNKQTVELKSSWCTPQLIAAILLLLAIVNLFIKRPYVDWLFLGLQTIMAIVMTYLLVFSDLPLTSWNWLIIPYNLLPIIGWHWRRYWALPYAGLMIVWVIGIAAWPHFLVHSANIVFTIAWTLILLKQKIEFKKIVKI